jgi:hypothetical protein
MNALYSLFREILTISSVNGSFQEHQKLWNTMKHSGRTFIYFGKDSLRDKTLYLSFTELNTYSQSDSRLFLKVT